MPSKTCSHPSGTIRPKAAKQCGCPCSGSVKDFRNHYVKKRGILVQRKKRGDVKAGQQNPATCGAPFNRPKILKLPDPSQRKMMTFEHVSETTGKPLLGRVPLRVQRKIAYLMMSLFCYYGNWKCRMLCFSRQDISFNSQHTLEDDY